MSTRNRKRSQQIHLLLLGAATLVASGCQNLNPTPDRPTIFNTEAECTAHWGSGVCSLTTVPGVDPEVPERPYWLYDTSTSLVTQAEPEPEGSNPVDQSLLPKLVGEIAKALTRVLRGGFGRSASRFGGAHT
jgi:hypothetical protein